MILGITAGSRRRECDGASISPDAIIGAGDNDYLKRASSLIASDNATCTFSAWIYNINSSIVFDHFIFRHGDPDSESYGVSANKYKDGEDFKLRFRDSSYTSTMDIFTQNDFWLDHINKWVHIMISVDVTNVNKRHFYVNGKSHDIIFNKLTGNSIFWTDVNPTILGGRIGNYVFNDHLTELYMTNEYIDLSLLANRKKFITGELNNHPADLGADGSCPTGTAPLIYFTGDAAAWNSGVNLGSGGNFTMTGAVNDSGKVPVELNSVFIIPYAPDNTITNINPAIVDVNRIATISNSVSNIDPTVLVSIRIDTLSNTIDTIDAIFEQVLVVDVATISNSVSNIDPTIFVDETVILSTISNSVTNIDPIVIDLYQIDTLTNTVTNIDPIVIDLYQIDTLTNTVTNIDPTILDLYQIDTLTNTVTNIDPTVNESVILSTISNTITNIDPTIIDLYQIDTLSNTVTNIDSTVIDLYQIDTLSNTITNIDPIIVEPYIINAVRFDGTNDYLQGTITEPTANKTFTYSFWIKYVTSTVTNVPFIISESESSLATGGQYIQFYGDNTFNVVALNSSGGSILAAAEALTLTDNTWYHILISIDLSNSANRAIYINDTLDGTTWLTYTNDTIKYNTYAQMSNFNSTQMGDYCIADFWWDNSYIDLSVTANRRKFIDDIGDPVNLGSTGNIPTGSAPKLFFSGDTTTWHTNAGTAGGLTEVGALTTCSDTP